MILDLSGLCTRFMSAAIVAMPFLSTDGCPWARDNRPSVCTPDVQVTESEPNDDMASAQSAPLADGNCLAISGTIADPDDVDVYDLGPFDPGDRIIVDVNTSGDQLDARAAVFGLDDGETIGTLFAVNDNRSADPDGIGPYIDEIVRHHSDHYYLGIERSLGAFLEQGSYSITVWTQRGGQAPRPQPQTLLLDFDGGSAATETGGVITVNPFDPAILDPSYAGRAQAVKDLVTAIVKENYADFNVTILSTDTDPLPPGGQYSTVFIGDTPSSSVGGEVFGVALPGVDPFNRNPADNAVVFLQNYTPEIFARLEPLSWQELGVAIGNVASHESGHLLGLNHVIDPSSVMNAFDSPERLLDERRFKRGLASVDVFDALGNMLTQDSSLLLAETVGGIVRVADNTISVGDTPAWSTLADLDGDGDLDLAACLRFANAVAILANDDDRSLAAPVDIDLGVGPAFVIAFDADGDGDNDLLTANPAAGNLTLLENVGAGQFIQLGTLVAGDRPLGLAAADFDGDDDQDLAVCNAYSNDVSVFAGDGRGGFTLTATHEVGEYPVAVIAADLNADHAADLVVASFVSNNLSVLLNNGDGTFADTVDHDAGIYAACVAAADFNNDGDIDLAVANQFSSGFAVQYAGAVNILIGNGDGTFAVPVEYIVSETAGWLVPGDFDADGDIDLAAASTGSVNLPQDRGGICVLLNKGDGTFAQSVTYQAGDEPIWVGAADLDHDDDLDLVATNAASDTVSIFLNAGNGTFGQTVPVDGE